MSFRCLMLFARMVNVLWRSAVHFVAESLLLLQGVTTLVPLDHVKMAQSASNTLTMTIPVDTAARQCNAAVPSFLISMLPRILTSLDKSTERLLISQKSTRLNRYPLRLLIRGEVSNMNRALVVFPRARSVALVSLNPFCLLPLFR